MPTDHLGTGSMTGQLDPHECTDHPETSNMPLAVRDVQRVRDLAEERAGPSLLGVLRSGGFAAVMEV
jgi:hypothetical protein